MFSERKLKGLLAPNQVYVKPAVFKPVSIKKSASPSPSPTAASNSHKINPNHGTLLYYGIPGVQNFFYNPNSQNEPIVPPSPLLEPFKLQSLKEIPLFSHASAHTAADSHGDQTRNQIQIDGDYSNSLCSLVKKLNVQFPSQPRNLEELLQRSFASMPSYSALQSPMGPAFPSPFIRSHTNTLVYQGLQAGSISDLSFRGSFAQKSSLSNSQILKRKSNGPADGGLIKQIADLISKENDGRIKTAISELLTQYGTSSGANEKTVNGIFGLGEKLSQGPSINLTAGTGSLGLFGTNTNNNLVHLELPKPKTIALSNGLTMNAVNRSPKAVTTEKTPSKFKTNPQNNKVEAARKELFVLSEFDEKRGNAFPSKNVDTNDFNLFDFTSGPPILSSQDFSPLISSAPILKEGFSINLMNQPAYGLASHSTSQQAASLSTNSSHSENQRGISNKKMLFELTGKFQPSSTFRLIDDIPLQNKILDINFTIENWNKQSILNLKNMEETKVKSKQKNTNKKSRSKSKKITVEEYVQHVQRSREDSNLTIEETWEDEESWDDEKPSAAAKKKGKAGNKK